MSQTLHIRHSARSHHAHVSHAKSAKYHYQPGMLSHLYQNMSASERSSIDRKVDEAFRKETGVATKLDWRNTKDRPEARIWLRMRDVAVAHLYLSKLQKIRTEYQISHEKFVSKAARVYQGHLNSEAEERGLPEEDRESALFAGLQAAHIAAEVLDQANEVGLWHVLLHGAEAEAAEGTASLVLGIIGPFLNLTAGLAEIGEKHASGRNVSERNCFRYGFASTLNAMANGGDWSGADSSGTIEGQMQQRGRRAAIRMVKEMGPEVGTRFLGRYAGPRGKDIAVKDLGGYEN